MTMQLTSSSGSPCAISSAPPDLRKLWKGRLILRALANAFAVRLWPVSHAVCAIFRGTLAVSPLARIDNSRLELHLTPFSLTVCKVGCLQDQRRRALDWLLL